jgi:predicted dehydrogenase
LEDIGIYCINAARYLFKAEPIEVTALAVQGREPRFHEVPEAVSATMRFPDDRLASFVCGFGETKVSEYRVIGAKGMLRMNPASTWRGDVVRTIVLATTIKLENSNIAIRLPQKSCISPTAFNTRKTLSPRAEKG